MAAEGITPVIYRVGRKSGGMLSPTPRYHQIMGRAAEIARAGQQLDSPLSRAIIDALPEGITARNEGAATDCDAVIVSVSTTAMTAASAASGRRRRTATRLSHPVPSRLLRRCRAAGRLLLPHDLLQFPIRKRPSLLGKGLELRWPVAAVSGWLLLLLSATGRGPRLQDHPAHIP